MRDDFLAKVKDTLARRAGMRCSNPNCRKPTTGPHDSPSKAVNIGVACHITGASPGGPRYDRTLSPEERSSIDNGIWLCQNCAKLVDNDEERYPVQTLREWKRIAEESVRHRVETASSVTPMLPPIRVLVVAAEVPGSGSFFERFAVKDAEIIRSVLLPSDRVDVLKDADIAKISQSLMQGYDVVHFEAYVGPDGSMILEAWPKSGIWLVPVV